jgi:hypothetical protein
MFENPLKTAILAPSPDAKAHERRAV